MSIINIQTKEIVTTQTATQVEIGEGSIQLDLKARFPVKLLDENGNMVHFEFVTLEGDDYAAWTNDDSYVTNFILNKLGITSA